MTQLKLTKLPDRVPQKLTVIVSPDLHATLQAYALAYREAYQSEERIEALIPAMLEMFIASDKAFAKLHKAVLPMNASRARDISERGQ